MTHTTPKYSLFSTHTPTRIGQVALVTVAALVVAACVTPHARHPNPAAAAAAPPIAAAAPATAGGSSGGPTPGVSSGGPTLGVSSGGPTVIAPTDRRIDPSLPAGTRIVTYELRRGETLAHFARWSELPVEAIAEASGYGLHEVLPVGAIVAVPLDEDGQSKVEHARDAHRVKRAEGWLATHGGQVGTEFYRVHTGDTASSIASGRGQMPVWVLETYNPASDLDALRPGDELMLPVVASRLPEEALTEAR